MIHKIRLLIYNLKNATKVR